MDMLEKAPHFSFKTQEKANQFIALLKKDVYKYDILTVNDVLRIARGFFEETVGAPVIGGFEYGYSKRQIKKLKAEKVGSGWVVFFPLPGRLVQDKNGYWTTEEEDGG